jgi:hypothetical protein
MKTELMTRILDGVPNLRKEGAAYLVPDDLDLSVFIGLPSEVLAVPRLARIEPAAELLTLETHKGERYYFATADVAGLKTGASEKRASGGAGFR